MDHIKQALTALSKSELPFGLSLLFGAPGETPQTISRTFELIDSFHVPHGIWVSIGICLWTEHQAVVDDARQAGQLYDDRQLFNGAYYISPELPQDYMRQLIASLRAREDCTVQVNKPYADYR